MDFYVIDRECDIPTERNCIGLVVDNWNDWFTYNTMYVMVYFDSKEQKNTYVGAIKIGEQGLKTGRPNLPEYFTCLSEEFFSLGQGISFYEELKNLGDDLREEILVSLNDIAYNNNYYFENINEDVLKKSLMRDYSYVTVRGQFNRLAHGNEELSSYNFCYIHKNKYFFPPENLRLNYNVVPNSTPPTNIHVIIGRNGVGKTYLLSEMVNSIINNDDESFCEYNTEGKNENSVDRIFANLIYVSYSAFDHDIPISSNHNSSIKYSYIGLKKKSDEGSLSNKDSKELKEEFGKAIERCYRTSRINLWKRIIETLNSDPIFEEINISAFFDNYQPSERYELKEWENLKEKAKKCFEELSSGHKIVLLSLSSLVSLVEERTLVIMDEPEIHLHPPLLAAFTRAISQLLIIKNGVAIIATHSPVVLQEVPSSCVWNLRRRGSSLIAERPKIECFGENVGLLTSEIFKHEVLESGFHKLLSDYVNHNFFSNYDEIFNEFNGQLGYEAQALLRILISERDDWEGTQYDED